MPYRYFPFVIALIFISMLASCKSAETTPGLSSGPENKSQVIPAPAAAKESWQEEWERVLKEAKKEGKVLIMMSTLGSELRQAITEPFVKRYGIKVELIQSPGGSAAQKVLAERRAGLYLFDLFFAGGSTILGIKSSGALDPIEKVLLLPEVVDSRMWWKGKLDFIDNDNFIIAFLSTPSVPWAINTDMVRPAQEPVQWKDLLQPGWKGKIAMRDPRLSGAPNTVFTVVAYNSPDLGLDYWKEFIKQDPMIFADQGLGVEWLTRGKFSLLIGSGPLIEEYIKAGAPVKLLMPRGYMALSSASGNVSLLNRAPHPNAARVYINWLLGREAQSLFSRASGYQSGRVDVPVDHLDPVKLRQPGFPYIQTSHEDFNRKADEALKAAQEIFAR